MKESDRNSYFSDLTDVYDFLINTYGEDFLDNVYISEFYFLDAYYTIAKILGDTPSYNIFCFEMDALYQWDESFGYVVLVVDNLEPIMNGNSDKNNFYQADITLKKCGYDKKEVTGNCLVSIDDYKNLSSISSINWYLDGETRETWMNISYNGDGRISSVISSESEFVYEYKIEDGRLSGITAKESRFDEIINEYMIELSYDGQGEKSGMKFFSDTSDGYINYQFSYDAAGRIGSVLVDMTFSRPYVFDKWESFYHYDNHRKILSKVMFYKGSNEYGEAEFDDRGNITSYTSCDAETGVKESIETYQYEFDGEGNIILIECNRDNAPFGSVDITEITRYDAEGRPLTNEISSDTILEEAYSQNYIYDHFDDVERRASGSSDGGVTISTPYLDKSKSYYSPL